jgi:cation/acetate symporter
VIGGVSFGLVSSVTLALIGPVFMGEAAIFPIVNPTILSMPLGFLGAVLGTWLGGRNRADEERFEEVRFRAHTGEGAEV